MAQEPRCRPNLMAEIRLSKLIKQFNIGLNTLVDFLNSKGAGIDVPSVNIKVSDEYLPELYQRFGKDWELREAADKIDVKALENPFEHLDHLPSLKPEAQSTSLVSREFDWDAFENEGVTHGQEETLAKYEQQLKEIHENEIVEGVVTSINLRGVIVNIGAKSEGFIPAYEFRYNPGLKVGDKVEVLVESAEDRKGHLVISHKKARQIRIWDKVNAAYESGEVVKGYVKTRTKGGMIVDVFGLEAFLPSSQIDIRPTYDYDSLVDTVIDLVIIQVNKEYRNVVVSHKAILLGEQEKKREELFSTLTVGQTIEGVVKNITKFGAFIDLGGVDGLVHISDLSWETITHPDEVVSLGQSINVMVLSLDREHGRIALGLKQLTKPISEESKRSAAPVPEIDPNSFFSAKALDLLGKKDED